MLKPGAAHSIHFSVNGIKLKPLINLLLIPSSFIPIMNMHFGGHHSNACCPLPALKKERTLFFPILLVCCTYFPAPKLK